MPKQFTFRGKTIEELEKMQLNEFIELLPARQRRSIKRNLTEQQKIFLEKVKKTPKSLDQKPIKTHVRDMIVLPEMVGLNIAIYNGKEFVKVKILAEMLGHFLGEFATTRKGVTHSAPGLGATKSSAAIAVK